MEDEAVEVVDDTCDILAEVEAVAVASAAAVDQRLRLG